MLALDNLAVGAQRLKGPFGDRGSFAPGPTEPATGMPDFPQLLRAIEIDLRLISLGLLSLDARLKRLHL